MKGLIGTDTQHSFPLTEFLLKPKLKLCKTKLTEPACAHNGLIIGRGIPQLCNATSSPIPEKQQTPLHCSCPQRCREVAKQCHPVLGCHKDISSNSSSLTRNLSSFRPAGQIQFLRIIHSLGPLPREQLSCEQGEAFWQLLYQGCLITPFK